MTNGITHSPGSVAYIRVAPESSEDTVRKMLRQRDRAFVDPGEGAVSVSVILEEAIDTIKKGDDLIVAQASELGRSTREVLAILKKIGAKGASVFDCETGERISCSAESLSTLEFAERAEQAARKSKTAAARKAFEKAPNKGGSPAKLEGARLEEARELWLGSALSAAEIASRVGVTSRTLHRKFGARVSSE